MTGGLVAIFLPLVVVAGTVYLFWRLGLGPEKEVPGYEAVETLSLPVYRRFERPWRWGMLICTLGLMLWLSASLLGLIPFTRGEFIALAVPFASMSLFGLYTGEITFRDSTVRREKNPIGFWLYFGLDLLLAGLILYLVATGSIRY